MFVKLKYEPAMNNLYNVYTRTEIKNKKNEEIIVFRKKG